MNLPQLQWSGSSPSGDSFVGLYLEGDANEPALAVKEDETVAHVVLERHEVEGLRDALTAWLEAHP